MFVVFPCCLLTSYVFIPARRYHGTHLGIIPCAQRDISSNAIFPSFVFGLVQYVLAPQALSLRRVTQVRD